MIYVHMDGNIIYTISNHSNKDIHIISGSRFYSIRLLLLEPGHVYNISHHFGLKLSNTIIHGGRNEASEGVIPVPITVTYA